MSRHETIPVFDPNAPLSEGVTLIEASAGTGKTYNISTLVVRLVAEYDLHIDEILIVTFTIAATAELKDRIRKRIGGAVNALRNGDAGGDAALGALVERAAQSEQTTRWLRRLENALESFDAAPISTIHGFCQRMLKQNAFESGADINQELQTDISGLLREVIDDYLTHTLYDIDEATHALLTTTCGMTRPNLIKLAFAATSDPEMTITPALCDVGVQDWLDAVEAFRVQWREESPAAIAAMLAALTTKSLQGSAYQLKRTQKNVASLEAWLKGNATPQLTRPPAYIAYFTASRIRSKAKDAIGEAVAALPLFSVWEDLMALASQMVEQVRTRFAHRSRSELARKIQERGLLSFQDLLRGLATGLHHPERGDELAMAIRERYRAALIDEFQDTDELQWQIFSKVFNHPSSYLYLIGDPKQAIYGFRGANIQVYLQAKQEAGSERSFTMSTNWRSDRGYVNALNHLMGWRGFFVEDYIEYVGVETPDRNPEKRLDLTSTEIETAPLQLRIFDARLERGHGDAPGELTKAKAEPLVPTRVAGDIVELLQSGALLWDETKDAYQKVGPGDIAVLVRKHAQARAIQRALEALQVPSVVSQTGSVFDTPEALALQGWLTALSSPGRTTTARACATSLLFGWRARDLATITDDGWELWVETLLGWQQSFNHQGFIRTFRAMLTSHSVFDRLLSQPGGERSLTNLLHLAELIHDAAMQKRLGLRGLIAWLEQARHSQESADATAQMRLETDDEAVQVVTMHHAKGLEYPLVFAPYLWDGSLLSRDDRVNLRTPDPEVATKRILDLHFDTSSEPKRSSLIRSESESRKENLRLLYVTLTRAAQRCYVYWGGVKDNQDSPLGAALFGADPSSDRAEASDRLTRAQSHISTRDTDGLFEDLETLAATSEGTIRVSMCTPSRKTLWQAPEQDHHALATRTFERPMLDRAWGQSSFSSLTHGREQMPPSSIALDDGERIGFDDDGLRPAIERGSIAHDAAAHDDTPVPLAAFPAGAEAGTFLHALFEELDFRSAHPEAPDPTGELDTLIKELAPIHGFTDDDVLSILPAGMVATLRTPLGGPLGSTRLCDIEHNQRIDELRFEFPIAGGNQWRQHGDTQALEARALAECMGRSTSLSPAYRQ
ncbi:MAG: UvrD-helicase domain-containing protein, partial [Myxococcota bacterium]|nr:UvrD-helicase domain-containing protein [Myxococcota bacterium]